MSNYKKVQIRIDDVLQANPVSRFQRNALKERTFFEWFKESDKMFKHYNCTLAVLSEGIDACPEWVEYIKKNIHRYKIELHGSSHFYYEQFDKEKILEDLSKAKEKIEETFGVKITTWYVPFGRKHFPKDGEWVCKRLGINLDIPKGKTLPKTWFYVKGENMPSINMHFWDAEQIRLTKKIIELCQKST